MNHPVISIVIANFNKAALLPALFASIQASDFSDYEIIFVDDFSTDASVETAGRFPVRIIKMSENRGPAFCRNVGAGEARGEFLLFCDSDVTIQPDMLRRIEARFRQTGAATVYGKVLFPPLGKSRAGYYWILENQEVLETSGIKTGPVRYWGSTCGAIRKSLFEEIGPFNEAYRGPDIEDHEISSSIPLGAVMYYDEEIGFSHHYGGEWNVLKKVFLRSFFFAKTTAPIFTLANFQSSHRKVGYLLSVALLFTAPLGIWLVPARIAAFFLLLGKLYHHRLMLANARRTHGLPFLPYVLAFNVVVGAFAIAGFSLGKLLSTVGRFKRATRGALSQLRRIYNGDLSYLLFHITAKCNARCDHCFVWKEVKSAGVVSQTGNRSLRPELSFEEIEQFSRNLPKLYLVNLCGGEPFLRDDLPELVKVFGRNCDVKYVTIPSNGFETEKIVRVVRKICRENPGIFFRLNLSLDAPGISHDQIRKYPGGYVKTMETARQLQELKRVYRNFDLRAAIVFSTRTESAVETLIEEIRSSGNFDAISINYIRGNPRDLRLKNPSLQGYRKASRMIGATMKSRRHPGSSFLMAMQEKTTELVEKAVRHPAVRQFKCFSGTKSLVINDIGNLYSCEMMMDRPMGNLRDFDYDYQKILALPSSRELLTFIEQKKCACSWECAINSSHVFDLKAIPGLFVRSLKNLVY